MLALRNRLHIRRSCKMNVARWHTDAQWGKFEVFDSCWTFATIFILEKIKNKFHLLKQFHCEFAFIKHRCARNSWSTWPNRIKFERKHFVRSQFSQFDFDFDLELSKSSAPMSTVRVDFEYMQRFKLFYNRKWIQRWMKLFKCAKPRADDCRIDMFGVWVMGFCVIIAQLAQRPHFTVSPADVKLISSKLHTLANRTEPIDTWIMATHTHTATSNDTSKWIGIHNENEEQRKRATKKKSNRISVKSMWLAKFSHRFFLSVNFKVWPIFIGCHSSKRCV